MADKNELKPMTARLLQAIAAECYREWYADRDSRVGKILRALADPSFAKEYRADIAELHDALNATATPPEDAPLATIEARYRDLLNRLGCNGHDGAIAEIDMLRHHLDAPAAEALRARAVPDDVAKDAKNLRLRLMIATSLLRRAEPFTICAPNHSNLNRKIQEFLHDAAILSAAENEVKNG